MLPDRINLKVGTMGNKGKKPPKHSIPTLEQIIKHIEANYADPEVRSRLIQKANEYPRGAMDQFIKNIKNFADRQ